jgi:hypothetical protein
MVVVVVTVTMVATEVGVFLQFVGTWLCVPSQNGITIQDFFGRTQCFAVIGMRWSRPRNILQGA